MFTHAIRIALMAACLVVGSAWLLPRHNVQFHGQVRFVERSAESGCANDHTMVQLADVFENIMPWLSSVGAAAAAADYDGDGFADLYVTNCGRGDHNRLFRNRGDGTFDDVTEVAGVACPNTTGASMHAIWGDIDNDGDLDLYVVKWAEAYTLFENRGDGTFVDISERAGIDFWGYANAAAFLDFDRDGWLDILVGNYFPETVIDPATGNIVRSDLWDPITTRVMHETFTHADNGGRNILYRNRGDGAFEDVTQAAGLHFTGWTLAVGAADLNNDGWPDLYLANDFGPDELYLNTGATENPPRFLLIVDPSGHPGIGADWWKGMNVDMADVNNDGYLDIYVTNVFERRYKTDEGNMLWINRVDPTFPGGRRFDNVAEVSGTADGGWGWGGKFADFNNDGLLDIYAVNGFVTGNTERNYWYRLQEMVTQTKNNTADAADWPEMGDRDLSGHERGRLFVQLEPKSRNGQPQLRFVEAAQPAGITDTYNGRGIAIADFDHDGDLDMYVANQGAPACYYVNQSSKSAANRTGGPSFLRLELKGRPELGVQLGGERTLASTADAVGARAILVGKRLTQTREVQGGMGFASQSEHALHFGVPDPADVERLEIRWPSGRVQTLAGQDARDLIGQHVRIREGEKPVMLK